MNLTSNNYILILSKFMLPKSLSALNIRTGILDSKCPVKCLNEEYQNEFYIQAESKYKSSQSESRIITTQISKALKNRRYSNHQIK